MCYARYSGVRMVESRLWESRPQDIVERLRVLCKMLHKEKSPTG